MTRRRPGHAEEMARRARRRAERRERSLAFAPRQFPRPRRETTDVDKVREAKEKRDRRTARRFRESALGGWRSK